MSRKRALSRAVSLLPGAAGASLTAVAASELAHTWWVGALLAGVYLLVVDWRIG